MFDKGKLIIFLVIFFIIAILSLTYGLVTPTEFKSNFECPDSPFIGCIGPPEYLNRYSLKGPFFTPTIIIFGEKVISKQIVPVVLLSSIYWLLFSYIATKFVFYIYKKLKFKN